MADPKPNKSLGQDLLQQAIDEVVPYIARWVYAMLPPAWRQSLKGHPIARILPSIISIAIGKLTPNGGLWDQFDQFRTEFFSSIGREIAEGKLDGAMPSMPTNPMAAAAVAQFTQAVEKMNLFVIDGALRDAILDWVADLPADEWPAAMDMVQGLSLVEIESFAQTSKDMKTVYWGTRPEHPANKPVPKPGKAEIWLKDLETHLDVLNTQVIEPAAKKQLKAIKSEEKARAARRQKRATPLGRFMNMFGLEL